MTCRHSNNNTQPATLTHEFLYFVCFGAEKYYPEKYFLVDSFSSGGIPPFVNLDLVLRLVFIRAIGHPPPRL